jgi:hypothetical protein
MKGTHLEMQSAGWGTPPAARRKHTFHVLEENAVLCVEKTLHNRGTGCMLQEDVIDVAFSTKLLSFKLAGLWDLDDDTRMDLIDEGDSSPPKPAHAGKSALRIHERKHTRTRSCVRRKAVRQKRRCGHRRLVRSGKEIRELGSPVSACQLVCCWAF